MRTTTDPIASESTRPTTNRQAAFALAALSIGTFSFVTTELLPIGLLPLIGADLDRSLSGTGLLVTGYAAVVVIVSVPLTRLTRGIPKRALLGVLLAVFALATLASAAAQGFAVLVAARMVIAVTQALFWSVIASTAAGLYPPHQRGRVVGALFTGSSLAPVVGLPAGTWVGQQFGWRVAFLTLSALAVLTCVTVVTLLPNVRPEDEPARSGESPDVRRYVLVLAATALGITGMFTAYTYVTAHLIDVAGLPENRLSAVFLMAGVVGVLGAVVAGSMVRRRPRAALILPLTTMTGAFWLLTVGGRTVLPAVTALALLCFAGSGFAAALQNRILQVAPGDTDLASAGSSSVYNAGIAAGSLLGGVIVAGPGVHATALAAALFTAAALALILAEPWIVPVPRHETR